MKKMKALYGIWSKCFYSCDHDSYENYIRTNNKLPAITFLNETPNNNNSTKIRGKNESFVNLLKAENLFFQTNNCLASSKRMDEDEKSQCSNNLKTKGIANNKAYNKNSTINGDVLRPLSSNIGDLTSCSTNQLKDMTELWKFVDYLNQDVNSSNYTINIFIILFDTIIFLILFLSSIVSVRLQLV